MLAVLQIKWLGNQTYHVICKMQVIFCYYIYFNCCEVYAVCKMSLSVRQDHIVTQISYKATRCHNLEQSPPWKSQNMKNSYVSSVQNIFEAASLLNRDIDPYVIITELVLNYIFNIRWQPESPYSRSD
jgi:hypothetical protein